MNGIGSRLKDCMVAMYNGGDRFSGGIIIGMCCRGGAKLSKVFTICSASRTIGGFYDSWWY